MFLILLLWNYVKGMLVYQVTWLFSNVFKHKTKILVFREKASVPIHFCKNMSYIHDIYLVMFWFTVNKVCKLYPLLIKGHLAEKLCTENSQYKFSYT